MNEWLLVFFPLMIASIAFWIWALVDAIRVPDDSLYQSGSKIVWVLVIVLVGWIGAIIYLAAGRPAGGAKAAIVAWQTRQGPGGSLPGSVPPPPPPAPLG